MFVARYDFAWLSTLIAVPSASTTFMVNRVDSSSTAFAFHRFLPCFNLLILSRSSITWLIFLVLNKVCQQRCFSISIKRRLLGLEFPPLHLFCKWWWFLPGVPPLCFWDLRWRLLLSRFLSLLLPLLIRNLLVAVELYPIKGKLTLDDVGHI